MATMSSDSSFVSRPKRTTKSYFEQFSTIQDGMKEMAELVPVVKSTFFQGDNIKLLENKMEDEDFTRGILNVITELFSASFPSIMNEDYPNTYSLAIRGDSFFFRTKNRISISWEYDLREIDNGNIIVNMRVIFTEPGGIVNANKIKTRQALSEAGWVETESRARNPRYSGYEKSTTIGETVANKQDIYDNVNA